MSTIQTIFVAVLVLVVLAYDKCFGYPSILVKRGMCEPCNDTCKKCQFGWAMASCGAVCTKGPGEVCGGKNDEWGICADGLLCHCNHCYGCTARAGKECKQRNLNEPCHSPYLNADNEFLHHKRREYERDYDEDDSRLRDA